MTARPAPGDLLRIDGRASVQFAGGRALTLRVVSVSDRHAYDGWIWLTGYVIDRRGDATAKREIYVQLAGIRSDTGAAAPPRPARPVARSSAH
ncbi:hypothetical protein [Micromonospora lutea]|uniref:Single-stranded DNA-binding protein n=1 Tax=Micromonospora lutea TaxID=419825 RepID=A0ABQ4IYR8_9ACTN|nr:hypothetical protein [Micromonospora lutea]GIJ23050.1 hypothetical protein Vlu01_36740 [Micromonospora lutea]